MKPSNGSFTGTGGSAKPPMTKFDSLRYTPLNANSFSIVPTHRCQIRFPSEEILMNQPSASPLLLLTSALLDSVNPVTRKLLSWVGTMEKPISSWAPPNPFDQITVPP